MGDCHAVLLDATGIQKYVFQSNRLKENLGASQIVSEIYRSHLRSALCRVMGHGFEEELEDLDGWRESCGDGPDCSKLVDIGYVGGGNALLFFRDKSTAVKFVEEWTKILLVQAPGLATAVAHGSFSHDPSRFQTEFKRLIEQLEINKAKFSPITLLARHGITAECPRSGVSAEIFSDLGQDFVSAGVYARFEAADKSIEELQEKYRDKGLLDGDHCLSNELDELGSVPGEDSHIAVVHIDGNDIGERFKGASKLKQLRELSRKIHKATTAAFEMVIRTANDRHGEIMRSLNVQNSKILPVRPIIIGGDDVTFVCDGRLGIYFAEVFMKEFAETEVENQGLSCCAGVAIIKTKYPFYRGYRLAEELCSCAKRKRKKETGWGDASVLDFHVAMGGVAGPLEEIRKRDYGRDDTDGTGETQVDLLYRPFKVGARQSLDEHDLDMFLEKAWQLEDDKFGLPKNKRHELRAVLGLPEHARREYVQALESRGRELPKIEGRQYHKALVENNKTPYFDMMEICRFYPLGLRENGQKS